jgi:hypothetical protein
MKNMTILVFFLILGGILFLAACGDDSNNYDCEAGCSKYFECEDELAAAYEISVEVLRANSFDNKGACVSQCEAEINEVDEDDDESYEACKNCFEYSDCPEIVECFMANCE